MQRRACLLFLLAVGCRDAAVGARHQEASWTNVTSVASIEPRRLGGCATLRGHEGPDILRVGQNGLAFYANEQVGLVIVDVSVPDAPRVLTTSTFTGAPVGVFERDHGVVVVYAPWDRPAETVVRAVTKTGRELGFSIAETTLRGTPRDARLVGDALIVTREDEAVIVSSFTLDTAGLRKRDELRLEGARSVTGGSPWGVAVARESDDRGVLTWIAVDDAGGLRPGKDTVMPGLHPSDRAGTVDVAEDTHVRILGCTTARCGGEDDTAYAALDLSIPDAPRLLGTAKVARGATNASLFLDGQLLVAKPAGGRAADATELALFDGEANLVPRGRLVVDGKVGSFAVAANSIIAVGFTGSAATGKRAVIHQVDLAPKGPRLLGSASFGSDWTWTPAYDDARAVSFDPRAVFAALPMTTVRGRSGPMSAVQVFALEPRGPQALTERSGLADRLVFVDGRLLAFGADGVTVVPLGAEKR